MNDKFFELPVEKQERIIKAAYAVFAHNNYKDALTSRIADAGDISKSLLFHCLWQMFSAGKLDPDSLEKDFLKRIRQCNHRR